MEKRLSISNEPRKRTRQIIPLKGEVCEQYVRCGKENCKCASGELHGPYYYRVYRENGTVHKVYVRRRELAGVRASVREYHRLEALLKEMRRRRVSLTRSIRAACRIASSIMKSLDSAEFNQ